MIAPDTAKNSPRDQRHALRLLLDDGPAHYFTDHDLDVLLRERGFVGAYRAARRLLRRAESAPA